jgi:hypothetical protein
LYILFWFLLGSVEIINNKKRLVSCYVGYASKYRNREFLRSFQLRSEIKEGNNGDKNNSNIITTDVASLVPPFETIGFLEAKWLEVLKELVEYGDKNILANFELYLVMEERREEEYAKEVTSGILDIKPEDKGKEQQEEQEEAVNQEQQHHHNGSKNNQFWSTRLRDKNGRFMCSSNTAAAATTAVASNTTTAVAITTTPTIATANHNHGIINYEIAGVGL